MHPSPRSVGDVSLDSVNAWCPDMIPASPYARSMHDGEYDVVVVGGRPGGLTAALVLSRARRKVLLIDDGTYRYLQVPEFHGFPGRDGTPPKDFRADGLRELERYDVEVTKGPAIEASQDASSVALELADGAVEARRLETCAPMNALVWAVGDVRRPPPSMPHQVVLAAADGSHAAIAIHKSLLSP